MGNHAFGQEKRKENTLGPNEKSKKTRFRRKKRKKTTKKRKNEKGQVLRSYFFSFINLHLRRERQKGQARGNEARRRLLTHVHHKVYWALGIRVLNLRTRAIGWARKSVLAKISGELASSLISSC